MKHIDKKNALEPPAPWLKYANAETWSFKQGESEEWFNTIWLPYWRKISPEERVEFLKNNPAPDDDWKLYLEDYWLR